MINSDQNRYIDCNQNALKPRVFYRNPEDDNIVLIGEIKGRLAVEESFLPRDKKYFGKNNVFLRGVLQPIGDPKDYIELYINQCKWMKSKLEQLVQYENKLPLSKVNPVAGLSLTQYPIKG